MYISSHEIEATTWHCSRVNKFVERKLVSNAQMSPKDIDEFRHDYDSLCVEIKTLGNMRVGFRCR